MILTIESVFYLTEGRIRMSECCGTCKWHYHDKDMLDGDYCCVNDQSEYVTDYTMYDDVCDEWEDRDE